MDVRLFHFLAIVNRAAVNVVFLLALSGSAFSDKEVPLPRGKAKWKLRTWEQKIQNEFSKGKQPQRRINGVGCVRLWFFSASAHI